MPPILVSSPIQPTPAAPYCQPTVFSRRGSVRLYHTQVLPGAAKVVHFAAGEEARRGRCCNPTAGRRRAETSRISGSSRKPRRKSQGKPTIHAGPDITPDRQRRLAAFLLPAPFHAVDEYYCIIISRAHGGRYTTVHGAEVIALVLCVAVHVHKRKLIELDLCSALMKLYLTMFHGRSCWPQPRRSAPKLTKWLIR